MPNEVVHKCFLQVLRKRRYQISYTEPPEIFRSLDIVKVSSQDHARYKVSPLYDYWIYFRRISARDGLQVAVVTWRPL